MTLRKKRTRSASADYDDLQVFDRAGDRSVGFPFHTAPSAGTLLPDSGFTKGLACCNVGADEGPQAGTAFGCYGVNALTCPVCKSVMTSSEKCSSCGLNMLLCPACGGLNPASNQVCLVCGDKLAINLTRDTRTARNSTEDGGVAVEVRKGDPRAFSDVREAKGDPTRLPVASAAAPAFTAKKGAIAGMARGCQVRQETRDAKSTWQILTFRLDRFDDSGRPLPSVPVEMRGVHLKGHINDGEWIEVPGHWKTGELLEPKRVRNLTTSSWVKVRNSWLGFLSLLGLVLFAVVLWFLFWNFREWAENSFRSVR